MENTFKEMYDEILRYTSLYGNDKILLVGQDSFHGGSQLLLLNMIRELKKRDYNVVVLVKYDGPMLESYKKLAPTFIIDTSDKIENAIINLNKMGFQKAILNTILSANLIPLLREYDFYTINLVHELSNVIEKLNAQEFARISAQTAHLIVFPSKSAAFDFQKYYEIKTEKLILPQGLYNVYDDFNKKKSRKLLEEKYNIPEENHIILNVGKAEKRKGFDLFFETSQKLNDKFTFIWVGDMDNEMKSEYSLLLDQQENLIFPGYISEIDELMIFYDACDLFILTSREDTFPSVILEAFNANTPVVAFKDAGSFNDIVIDDVSGYLVEYESTDELMDKIKLICSDERLMESLADNAKKISLKYNFSNYITVLLNHLGDGVNEINNN